MSAPRRARALLLWAALLSWAPLAALAACSSTPNPQHPTTSASALLGMLSPVEAALAARRWDDAAAQAQALIKRLPDDPCVGAAHLLRGRALVGAQAWGEALASLNLAQALGCDGGPEVARAAADYKALAALRRGGVARGLEALGEDAPPKPSRWVPAHDAAPLLWLAAERRLLAADPVGALTWLSEAVAAADPQDPAFIAHLRARAWSIPDAPPLAAPPLAKAVGAYHGALAALSDPDLSAADRAARVDDAAAALDAAGEPDRAAALRQLGQRPAADAAVAASVTLGAVLPLSGPNRKVGRMAMAGLLLALGAFSPGATPQVKVLFEDDGSQPERAAAAVRKLASEGAALIFGPLDPAAVDAAARAAAEVKVPLLALSAAPLSAPSPYGLRLAPSAQAEATALCQQLLALNGGAPARVLALHPDLPYGAHMTEALAEALAATGAGSITATRAYPPDATDLRKLAAEVAALPFDAVFIPDAAERAARVASFLAQENLWPRADAASAPGRGDARRFVWLLGASVWMQEGYASLKPLEHGLFAAAYGPGQPAEAAQAFERAFRLVFGRAPGLVDALAFDAMGWARAAIAQGASTPAAMRAAFAGDVGHPDAVTGDLRLDPTSGAASPRFLVVRIERAQPVWLPPPPPALTP